MPPAKLYIAPSLIPLSGCGLYTSVEIKQGECFAEYFGPVYTSKELEAKKIDSLYLFEVSKNHIIDAANVKECFARCANDASGFIKINGLCNNTIWNVDESDNRVFFEAKVDIPAHSEILIDYGKQYW